MAEGKRTAAASGGGNSKSAGTGGGKGAKGVDVGEVAKNATVKGETPSPGGRGRGETAASDRS